MKIYLSGIATSAAWVVFCCVFLSTFLFSPFLGFSSHPHLRQLHTMLRAGVLSPLLRQKFLQELIRKFLRQLAEIVYSMIRLSFALGRNLLESLAPSLQHIRKMWSAQAR